MNFLLARLILVDAKINPHTHTCRQISKNTSDLRPQTSDLRPQTSDTSDKAEAEAEAEAAAPAAQDNDAEAMSLGCVSNLGSSFS